MSKLPTLDLHGIRVEEVADRIDRFIVQQTAKGAPRARVMTGKGTGKVQAAAIEYLRLGGFPWQHERMENGAKNIGVLVVSLA